MILDFDSTKWQQIWFTQVPVNENRLVAPLLLTSSVIALMMTVNGQNDPNKWQLGAYVQREVFTGLTLERNDARLDGSRKLFLNRLQVFTYQHQVEYSLIVNPFAWGSGVTLAVWEYTGVIN